MRICNCCGKEKTLNEFANGDTYVNKHGEKKHYRRKTCKACYSGRQRNAGREQKRDAFNRLVSWAVPMFVLIITGIYQHDYITGQNRICIYSSIYGDHAVTINAMRMCPLTWKFEVGEQVNKVHRV